jgi:hypothetical protein
LTHADRSPFLPSRSLPACSLDSPICAGAACGSWRAELILGMVTGPIPGHGSVAVATPRGLSRPSRLCRRRSSPFVRLDGPRLGSTSFRAEHNRGPAPTPKLGLYTRLLPPFLGGEIEPKRGHAAFTR